MVNDIILGIVGSEAAKFTPDTEKTAKVIIDSLIEKYNPVKIVSGGCHLGGIDIWACEAATKAGLQCTEFLPKNLTWNGGYKERNIQIAKASDIVVCITVEKYPESYKGMKFKYCYHCDTDTHIKSGGCWTTKYARASGKLGLTIVVKE